MVNRSAESAGDRTHYDLIPFSNHTPHFPLVDKHTAEGKNDQKDSQREDSI